MLPYNIVFISIFILVLIQNKIPALLNKILLVTFFFILVLFVGLRHEVGGDWFSYTNYISDLRLHPYKWFNFRSDWGFNLILYIFFNSEYNIYIVNFICASIFIFAIFYFAYHQNNPLMVLFVSVPYIINVIGMGYTRQSVAYAFLIFAFFALKNQRNLFFLFLIISGSLFHKSLIIFLILYIINIKKISIKEIIGFTIFTSIIIAVVFYRLDTIQFYIYYYLGDGQHLQSKGTIVRYLINLIPAIIIILYFNKLKCTNSEKKLYLLFSLFTICGLLLFQFAPTAFDRIGLYLTIIQLYVYSNLDIIFKNSTIRKFLYVSVFFLYFAINYVWLNFSTYKGSWIPYNLLFYQFY